MGRRGCEDAQSPFAGAWAQSGSSGQAVQCGRGALAERAAMFAQQHIGGDEPVTVAAKGCGKTGDGGLVARGIGRAASTRPSAPVRAGRWIQRGAQSSPQNRRILSAPGSPIAGNFFRSLRAPGNGRLADGHRDRRRIRRGRSPRSGASVRRAFRAACRRAWRCRAAPRPAPARSCGVKPTRCPNSRSNSAAAPIVDQIADIFVRMSLNALAEAASSKE